MYDIKGGCAKKLEVGKENSRFVYAFGGSLRKNPAQMTWAGPPTVV